MLSKYIRQVPLILQMDLKSSQLLKVYSKRLFEYLQIAILLFQLEVLFEWLFRNTNSVLSKIDLTRIFPICGFLYGGSSSTKDDGIPFKIVLDNIFDIISVSNIPKTIIKSTANVEIAVLYTPVKYPPIKIVEIAIKNGNLPLQGIKLFVKIPINFSLFESIILHPTTPAALQPSPIHIVNACFP